MRPSYPSLLAIQLVMLAFAGGFTPLAAGAAALLVSEDGGAAAISSILVGWALAIAAGLPLVSLIAPHIGWQATYGLIGILAAVSFLALLRALPRGLHAKPIIFATWGEVGRSRDLKLLLLITCLIAIGQYAVIAFAGPLLIQLTNATPARIAAVFALFGVMTLVGNICASRVVQTWGAFRTSAVFMAFMVLGVALWAFGAGIYLSMAAGAAIWGFGFAAVAAMQQVRLIRAAPPLATASVAINNTAVYLGQAIGAAIGGAMFAAGKLNAMGFVGLAYIAASFGLLWLTTFHTGCAGIDAISRSRCGLSREIVMTEPPAELRSSSTVPTCSRPHGRWASISTTGVCSRNSRAAARWSGRSTTP